MREDTDTAQVEGRHRDAAKCVYNVETNKVEMRLLYCKELDSDSCDVTHKFLARSAVM